MTLAPCTCCQGARKPGQGARGWCVACYHRWWRAGRPDVPPPQPMTRVERIAEYQHLRSAGESREQAAARLGVLLNTAYHYDAALHDRAQQERRTA